MPSLFSYPVHLGLGATVVPQPELTNMEWYEAYAARTVADGREGRLVGMHHFTENWNSWEMHPQGEELVLCLEGRMTIHQEFPDGTKQTLTIGPGDYAINPAGAWHTADIDDKALALFITAGIGTQHRPR